jgi:hypothetical protein
MIKTTTVLRRMVTDHWKTAATVAGTVTIFMILSYLAEAMFGVSSTAVYWMLIMLWFVAVGAKWAFEAKRSQIDYERRQMLRDIERKHL